MPINSLVPSRFANPAADDFVFSRTPTPYDPTPLLEHPYFRALARQSRAAPAPRSGEVS